jgi:hypothetical protein
MANFLSSVLTLSSVPTGIFRGMNPRGKYWRSRSSASTSLAEILVNREAAASGPHIQ